MSNLREIFLRKRPVLAKTVVLTGCAALCLIATGCFRVNSETAALRDGLLRAGGSNWEQRIEIGVGSWTWTLAQAALAQLKIEPEARAMLGVLHGADVGVFRLRPSARTPQHGAMLLAANQTMSERGWERIVEVKNDGEFVSIFVPKEVRWEKNVKICVVVINESEMVIASARGNLQPLFELAMNKSGLADKGHTVEQPSITSPTRVR
jgi:hypothetical protein